MGKKAFPHLNISPIYRPSEGVRNAFFVHAIAMGRMAFGLQSLIAIIETRAPMRLNLGRVGVRAPMRPNLI